MTHRIVVNVQTGETTQVDLTAEEIAALQVAEEIRLSQVSYAVKRQQAYPSIADQLDLMYHGGYDAWKAAIQSVKEEFPK